MSLWKDTGIGRVLPWEDIADESERLLEMRKAGQDAKKATTLESRMNALTLHAVYTSPGHSCFCPAILPNVLSIDRLTLVKSPIFPAGDPSDLSGNAGIMYEMGFTNGNRAVLRHHGILLLRDS